jgi:drug/metabolite transporter (DMT)-like permease
MFTGMTVTFVLATTMTTAANAIILQYTAPAWVFVLSPFVVGERAEPRQWLAFAVSMLAVGFIFVVQYTSDNVGLVIGLASGVVFGTQVVLFRRVRAMDPVVLAFLCCAGSGVILTPIAIMYEGFQVTSGNVGLMALAGVAQFGLPYVLYAAGSRWVPAQRAILIIMLEPVLNPIWVFIAHGEKPHWSTLVGGGLILASVCYLSMTRTTADHA